MYPVIVDLIPHARDLLGAREEAEDSAVDGQRSHDRRAKIAQRSVEGRGHGAPTVHVAPTFHVAPTVHVAPLRVHVALLLRDDARDRRAEIAPRSCADGVYDLVHVALDDGEPRGPRQSEGGGGRGRVAQVRGERVRLQRGGHDDEAEGGAASGHAT